MTEQVKNISLFVPYVFANLKRYNINNIFEGFGSIRTIDLVEKMRPNGTVYTCAYIHFDYWYNTRDSIEFQQILLGPDEKVYFVYDDKNSYLVVLENKARKVVPGERKKRIDLGDLDKCEDATKEEEPTIAIAPGLDPSYFTKNQSTHMVIAPGLGDMHMQYTTK
jgi:hypothetical protein